MEGNSVYHLVLLFFDYQVKMKYRNKLTTVACKWAVDEKDENAAYFVIFPQVICSAWGLLMFIQHENAPTIPEVLFYFNFLNSKPSKADS